MNKQERNIPAWILFGISFIISFYLASKFYGWVFVGVIPFPMKYPVIYGYNEFIPTSIILGIISILVCWYLTRTYFLRKDKKSIWYFPYLAIVTSLFFHGLFFVIEMKYTFNEHPQWFMYMDSKGEYIENPERYFGLVEKYGFDGDTYRPFKTLDDAIQGLEFAKEKKNGMYGYIFRDLEVFGYEEVFKKYDDVYFQLYFASEMIRDLGILNKYLFENYVEKLPILINYISDAEIKKLYEEIYTGYLKLEDKDPNYNEPMIKYENMMINEIETLFKQFGY